MRRRRGHILPMTLAILALASVALARACRVGVEDALAAAREAQDLQRRWGVLSCRDTFLPAAGAILSRREQQARLPTASLQTSILLGSMQFGLRFGDELAKASLNAIHGRGGAAATEAAARAAARAAGTTLTVRLRPLRTSSSPRPFRAFGQVFDESAAMSAAPLLAATADLTCFGNGKLNWRRAAPAALAAIIPDDRDLARQLQALQAAAPQTNPEQALRLTGKKANIVQDRLTSSSACQSLWIWSGTDVSLAVRELREDGKTDIRCFSWGP